MKIIFNRMMMSSVWLSYIDELVEIFLKLSMKTVQMHLMDDTAKGGLTQF